MNVNNNVTDLTSINNKLEFKATKENINNTMQKIAPNSAASFAKGTSKNQLFDMGGLDQEDVKDALSSEPTEFVKGALVALGNTTTEDGLEKLDDEGHPLKDTEVKTIVTVVDKIQIYLASHCEDFQATADFSQEELAKVTGNTAMAYEVAKKLQENNLPATDENIEDSLEALNLAGQLGQITDGTAKYMINNKLEPTIENVYKAEFSGQVSNGGTYGAGYFTEGTGYYGKTSDEFNWDNLQGQMSKVITNAGLEVNDDTMADAKWLVENHIPLTEESIKGYEDIKSITFPIQTEDVLDSIVEAIKEGKRPAEASLSGNDSLISRAISACEVVETTSNETLSRVIESGQPITLANLKKVQQQDGTNAKSQTDTKDSTKSDANAQTTQEVSATSTIQVDEDNISYITARRQLEEIRLQMTAQANYQLLKQGISIETQDLATLIDQLKNAEDAYYKQIFSEGNVEATKENVASYKEITAKVSDIKFVPNTVLASVVAGETADTINGIHQKGTALKSTYETANQSYEALMTKPRTDMGDKISKAFQNVDDILKDLGLETTESNQRATRILGYNSMEITAENINAVKAVDAAVNSTMSNMTPKVVLTMIREGINPLDMSLSDLNRQIGDIKTELGADDTQEKYSEFLYKLEKSNQITATEREAYIGMYRLMNNVEKTDGEVIGALVNQNADITLKNLLTGVRNIKNKGIDVSVDDNFGGLESLHFKATTISQQLEAGFQQNSSGSEQQQQNSQNTTQAQTLEYYNNLVDKALREISPEKLSQVFENGNIKDMSLEQFVDEVANATVDKELTKSYYKEQLASLKQAAQVEEGVIKMLTDYDQPVTINNLLAANTLMSKRGSVFKQLLSKDDEGKVLETAEELTKSITSKEDLTQSFEALEKVAMEALDKQTENPEITSIDLKEIQLLQNQIKLTGSLSKEEKYEIPIKIGEEVTSISLTVVHGQETGKVSITMESEATGKVGAEFNLKDKSASGYVVTDSQKSLDSMKQALDGFASQLEQSGITLKKMDYITSKSLNLSKFGEEVKKDGSEEASTGDLYSVAKAFVISVQRIGKD
jgi:hypothetical protein